MKLSTTLFLLISGIVATMAVFPDPATVAECIAEGKLNEADAKIIEDRHSFLKDPEKATTTVKCYYDCMFKKLDLVDASGNIKSDVVSKILIQEGADKSKVQAMVERCADIKGEGECEKVFNYRACLY